MASLKRLLARAAGCHERGDLIQAESLYREILRVDPQHPDALHLLGVAEHQRGRNESAAAYIRSAIALHESAPLYHNNLGATYQALGRLEDAAAEYQRSLEIDAASADAWFNLANVRMLQEDWLQARHCYERGLKLDGSRAAAWNNLGHVLQSLSELDSARDCYERAICLDPGGAAAHFNLGNVLERLGRASQAAGCYRRVLEREPRHWKALFNLANACLSLGRFDEACRGFEAAVEIDPGLAADAYTNLGLSRMRAGLLDEAEAWLRRALGPDAQHPRACGILGTVLKRLGRLEESIASYRRALQLDPCHAETHNNLGTALQEMGDLSAALSSYDDALRIDPHYADALNNVGTVLHETGDYDAAMVSYRRALELKPEFADALVNLGTVHSDRCVYTQAIDVFGRAIRVCPDHVEAHFHLAAALLALGRFEEGWQEYAWRWKRDDFTVREFGCPAWDGSPLSGQTILVYSEQGIGDEIMFASCLPELASASRCIVECDPRLVPLFARSFPALRVIAKPAEWQLGSATAGTRVNWQAAVGSLPRWLRDSLDAFPRRQRYLIPDAKRVAVWRERLERLGPGLKIGISWRGGKTPGIRRRRSTTLADWSDVLGVPGVEFVNLQYGTTPDELGESAGVPIHDWSDADPLRNLDDFAAQITALDLVISVDNATVHMAGALGVPVWVLLPFSADWRWMTGRDDSPWYAAARLIRQEQPEDWSPVFRKAAAALAREVDRRASAPLHSSSGRTETTAALGANQARSLRDRARRLHSECKPMEAAACLELAIQAEPDAHEVHNNLGVIRQELGRLDDAIACYRRALELKPDFALALFNLGNAYRQQDRMSAARDCYEQSLELLPQQPDCYLNLGEVLQAEQRLAEAETCYAHCLEIDPGNAEARFNRSLVWLQQGRFEQGWPEYEWRWADLEQPRSIPQPVWDGSPLSGRSILVTAEQGIGDEIMFASCIADVAGQAGECIVECSPRLVPLFSRSFPSARIVARPIEQTESAWLERADVYAAAGTLPRYVRTDLSRFPVRPRYVAPDRQRRAEWRKRLDEFGSLLKIGISWRGGRDPDVHRRRSTSLDQWAPLFAVPDARFVNLQYGDCRGELDRLRDRLGVAVYDPEDLNPLEDLDGLAALIGALDLVISVDNATVHLAGAVGAAVWTLLPVACDWRWLTDREESPWYPSMRLFRQTRFGRWDDVFDRVARELVAWKSAAPSA